MMREYLGEVNVIFDYAMESFLLDGVPMLDENELFIEHELFVFNDFLSSARVGHCVDIFIEG